jgi:hypothetical protein
MHYFWLKIVFHFFSIDFECTDGYAVCMLGLLSFIFLSFSYFIAGILHKFGLL